MKVSEPARVTPPRARFGITFVIACLVPGAAQLACTNESSSAAPVHAATVSAAGADLPDVLATIGDESITMEDIRTRVGEDLDGVEITYQLARHKLIDGTLSQILRERILAEEAEKQGKTIQQLIEEEAGPAINPTEIEVAAWYEENTARVGNRPLEQLRPQIVDYLRTQRLEEASQALEQRLNRERRVTVQYERYRLPHDNDGAPSLGPEDAPVTLVEFSDFECPYCGRFHPTLRQLAQEFGDDLRIVYRQYPIHNLHPNAQKAAEASLCAHEQGKFWELHDLMFQEQTRLGVRDLKDKAGRLGLDQTEFDSCLDSGRYVERIQDDQREARQFGVDGTPAIFINGVPLEGGAVAYDVVARAVRQALERSQD